MKDHVLNLEVQFAVNEIRFIALKSVLTPEQLEQYEKCVTELRDDYFVRNSDISPEMRESLEIFCR